MKSLVTALAAIFCFISADAQKLYEKMGIRFKIPYDWKIIDEQPEKNAIYFSCEKQGYNESGIVNFIYLGSGSDLNSFLLLCMQNVENTARMNECDSFAWGGDTTDVHVGTHYARKVTYKIVYSGLEFAGEIYVFNACGNLVMLNPLEAVEDEQKNRKGFRQILGTIMCSK